MLSEQLGVTLDPALLELAFTHRSFAFESGSKETNERLEFLGDSVLGLIVTEELYKRCLLYTSPSPRDLSTSRMPSSA